MGRLRLYADARGATALHESGFSWLAAFSLSAWALQRRLYGVAAASLLYGLGLGLVAHLWQLGRIRQPTQIVWGDDDPMGSTTVARRVADAIPRAELHIVQGGHAPWLTQAGQIGSLASAFLGRHTAAGASAATCS